MAIGATTAVGTARRRRESAASIALGTVVAASATPYGYTIATWSSGALLIHSHGAPGPGEIFLFAAGALTAFALLGWLSHGLLGAAASAGVGSERVLAGALHWFAVGIALAAVVLIGQIPGWVAWPLGSFAATTLYLIGASIQLALVVRRS